MTNTRIHRVFGANLNFYQKGFIFTALSFLAAALNYALYPAIARILDVAFFGEFTTLLALVTQIGGVLLAFNVVSIVLVAQYGEQKSKIYIASIQKGLTIVFAVLSILLLILFPFFKEALNLTNFIDLLLLSGLLILTIPSAIWTGYFQGNGELVRVGVFSVSSSALKLIAAITGGYYFGLTGALTGVLVGTIIGIVFFWVLPGTKPPVSDSVMLTKTDIKTIKRFLPIITRSVVAVGILSLMQIYDLLSIRALYPADESGTYAGISTLARIVFYLGFIILWVVVPEIAKATKKHRKNLITKSYILYGAIGTFAALGSIIAGNHAIRIVMGDSFVSSSGLLCWAIIFQTTVLFVTLQTFILLSFNARKFILILALGASILFLISVFEKDSTLQLVKLYSLCMIAVSLCLSIIINSYGDKVEEVN